MPDPKSSRLPEPAPRVPCDGLAPWGEDALDAYLAGDLPAEDARRVEAHLEACPICARERAWAETVQEGLGALPLERCPESVTDRVLETAAATTTDAPLPFRPPPTQDASAPRWRSLLKLAAALGAVALALSLTQPWIRQGGSPAPPTTAHLATPTEAPADPGLDPVALPEGLTTADVERAEREARFALATLGSMTRKVGTTVQNTVQRDLMGTVLGPLGGRSLGASSFDANGDRLE